MSSKNVYFRRNLACLTLSHTHDVAGSSYLREFGFWGKKLKREKENNQVAVVSFQPQVGRSGRSCKQFPLFPLTCY